MTKSHFWTRTIAAVAMLAAGTTAAFAAAFEDGAASYRRGDYGNAIRYWTPIAATDATVQNNIGIMYMNGRGVPRNYNVAMQWLSRSAAGGSSLGQNNLGGLYRDGKGVQRDYSKALTYFAASASQGNAAGQLNLGLLYLMGQGTRPDPLRAHIWFDIAAAQGMRNAAVNRSIAQSRMSPQQVQQARALAQQCANRSFKNCA